MTISVAATPVRAILSAATSHQVALTGVQAADTIELQFLDRTGGGTISSVTDNNGGTYTARSALANSMAIYVLENTTLPSGGNLTITVATNNIAVQLVALIVRSDAGGGVYATFDQAAASTAGSGTTADSNTVGATAAGLLTGALGTGNTQGSTPTVGNNPNLTGETVAPAGGAGVRSFVVYGSNAASGTLGFTAGQSSSVTIASSAWSFHLINFIESGGGGAAPVITSVGGDNSVTLTETNIAVVGTDFDLDEFEMRQGAGVFPMNIDSSGATSAQVDMPSLPGESPKCGAVTFAAINVDTQEGTKAGTVAAPAGWAFVDVASIAVLGQRVTAIPDIEIADQILYGGTITGGGTLSDVEVLDDTSILWTEGLVTSFEVRVWDHDTLEWSIAVVQTISVSPEFESGNVSREGRRRRRQLLIWGR